MAVANPGAKLLSNIPELFEDMAGVWGAFVVLHEQRTNGLNGPNPISICEIESFVNLFPFVERRTSFLVAVVQALDKTYLEHVEKRSAEKRARNKRSRKAGGRALKK